MTSSCAILHRAMIVTVDKDRDTIDYTGWSVVYTHREDASRRAMGEHHPTQGTVDHS